MRNELNVWALWSLVRLICSEWLKAFHSFGKKNKPGAARLWFMKDEVWLKSNDGSQTSLTQIDSLGPVSTSPKRHTCTQMLSRIKRTYVTSQEEKSAWSTVLQVSWGAMKLCELISSHFLALSFCAPQRWCLLGGSLPYRGIRAVWESCTLQIIKNELA